MTSLPYPYPNKMPEYHIRLFNTMYRPYQAIGNDVNAEYDPGRCGWYDIPLTAVGFMSINIEDKINEKSTAQVQMLGEEQFYLKFDTVAKCDDPVYFPKSADNQPVSTGSRLLVQIDSEGISSPDTLGSITISGTDVNDSAISETVDIDGDGAYLTDKEFKTIDTDGISESGLSNCVISVFGDIGTNEMRREIQIWCDTDNDGVAGLMFAGYIFVSGRQVKTTYDVIQCDCFDYTDDLMSNEYVAGYRAQFRCSNYTSDGVSGSCSLSSSGTYAPDNWQKSGKCFVGDFNTSHPNGSTLSTDYRCGDYSADTTKPLPFDNYTYDEGYADDADSEYEYCPSDYVRALLAIKRMMNSLEDQKVVSKPWDLHTQPLLKLNADIADGARDDTVVISYTNFDYIGFSGENLLSSGDRINIDNEWFYVSSIDTSTNEITTVRGSLLSKPEPHTAGAEIICPTEARSASNLSTFSHDTMLIEPTLDSTVYKTGTSLADIATERLSSREHVFWCDFHRQIHLTELDLDNAGSSTNFEITEDNVLSVSNIEYSDTVNKVSAWVETDNGRFYCSMRAEDTGITDYDKSINIFGIRSKEVDNSNLNAIGQSDIPNNIVGFETFATNYLKTHAFPELKQTLTVDSFVPDERAFDDVSDDPAFMWTDYRNRYITLLGTKVDAPDYSQPVDSDGSGDRPVETFVITAIEYDIQGCGNFDTNITMSRLTSPDEFI